MKSNQQGQEMKDKIREIIYTQGGGYVDNLNDIVDALYQLFESVASAEMEKRELTKTLVAIPKGYEYVEVIHSTPIKTKVIKSLPNGETIKEIWFDEAVDSLSPQGSTEQRPAQVDSTTSDTYPSGEVSKNSISQEAGVEKIIVGPKMHKLLTENPDLLPRAKRENTPAQSQGPDLAISAEAKGEAECYCDLGSPNKEVCPKHSCEHQDIEWLYSDTQVHWKCNSCGSRLIGEGEHIRELPTEAEKEEGRTK